VVHTDPVQPRYERTNESCLVTGTRVVAKSSADRDEQQRARFRHEIGVYRGFCQHPPPVTVPALIMAGGDRLLVIQRLDGTRLDGAHYPTRPPDDAQFDAILTAITTLNDWRPQPEAFGQVLDYPALFGQYRRLGLFTESDEHALSAGLALGADAAEFNHGDPRPDNILLDTDGGVALIDWAWGGWFRPGYDLAVLFMLFTDVPYARNRIKRAVADRGIEVPFTVNLTLVIAGELRRHRERYPSTQRNQLLARLEPLYQHARQRLHQVTGTRQPHRQLNPGAAAFTGRGAAAGCPWPPTWA
jgi:hypothetical protein